jgi:hypothetical protein
MVASIAHIKLRRAKVPNVPWNLHPLFTETGCSSISISEISSVCMVPKGCARVSSFV